MAALTMGYSFAFQLLGSLAWQQQAFDEGTLEEYRTLLFELSYDKIWSELSEKDREVTYCVRAARSSSVQDIRALMGKTPQQFAPYRDRVIRKGIVSGQPRGHMSLALPLFDEYVDEYYDGPRHAGEASQG